MFKRAKKKIVISILAILATVLVGTLSLIYISSYLTVMSQDYQVLTEHAQQLTSGQKYQTDNSSPDDETSGKTEPPSENNQKRGKLQRHLELGTFYTVMITSDGTSEVIENRSEDIYSDDELIALAQKVCSGNKGQTGELLYLVTENNDEILVCFMDNTVFSDSFSQVFLYTLLFGVIAMIAITFISMHIANRIVSPMEETYQKQKQFTADAGHELKTPIAAMAANIELLHREIGENEWLNNVSYENERMRGLVTELLELARNENRLVVRKPTDLSRLMNSVILPMEATAFEKNILIESEIPEGVTVLIDENSINQLLTILVDNAISHTDSIDRKNGKIRITLTEVKGSAIIAVTNPGEEIPEKDREKLFERFYRTDNSREYTGHYGLGLAIAKAIADANHVRLTISCQNGQVTFSAVIPGKY